MGWQEKWFDLRMSWLSKDDPTSKFVRLSDELNRLMAGPKTDQAIQQARQLTSQIINTGDKIPGNWRVAAKHAEEIIIGHEQRLAVKVRQIQDADVEELFFEAIVTDQSRRLSLDQEAINLAMLYTRACIVAHHLNPSEH